MVFRTVTSVSAVAFVMTPPGRGGVATICLHGDVSLVDRDAPAFSPRRGGLCADLPLHEVVFGSWGSELREEVVLCRVSEDETEIHCHGGRAAVERILGDLQSRGCQVETWVQHIGGALTALESECIEALTQATTLRTARHLLAQQQGALSRGLHELLSFDDTALREGLKELLRGCSVGLHLVRPWSVVLCGRPNVGKSSLINALVGYRRAIVYDQPGTTRDVVQAETALDGWPIAFSDTAGLREGADELEQAGIARAREQMQSADLLIVVIDGSQRITDDDCRLLTDFPNALVVLSKADLPPHDDVVVYGQTNPAVLRVSAVTGTGVAELQCSIVSRLIPNPPATQTPLLFTPRQVRCIELAAAAKCDEESKRWIEECLTQRPDAAGASGGN
jgi:tRNA modification GTPase